MAFDRVAVVSTAQTELRPEWGGAQHIDLISAVVAQVFKGTGLTLDDVDFVFDSGSDVLDGRSISNCGFLGALGAHHKEESRVEEDGLWAAQYGVTKIASGAARVGLIVAHSKPSESAISAFYTSQVEPFYQRPVGFDHIAASGLQAQAYMARSGVTARELAGLAHRRWAAAAARGRVAIAAVPGEEDILAAPVAGAPLTEGMLSRPVDGAVAILLASEDIARRCSLRPVWVTGMGSAIDSHAFATRTAGRLAACEAAAGRAVKQAGWTEIAPDVAEISASSAASELMVLEATGLAAENGAAAFAGATQVNLSGGALPADPVMATGLVRLAEGARQLSWPGEYGLSSARSALVHAASGVGMQSHCVFALEV